MAETNGRQPPENQERDEVLKRMLKMKPKPHNVPGSRSKASKATGIAAPPTARAAHNQMMNDYD